MGPDDDILRIGSDLRIASAGCKTGPYVYADLETMHHMMTEPGFAPRYLEPVDFRAAIVKVGPVLRSH